MIVSNSQSVIDTLVSFIRLKKEQLTIEAGPNVQSSAMRVHPSSIDNAFAFIVTSFPSIVTPSRMSVTLLLTEKRMLLMEDMEPVVDVVAAEKVSCLMVRELVTAKSGPEMIGSKVTVLSLPKRVVIVLPEKATCAVSAFCGAVSNMKFGVVSFE